MISNIPKIPFHRRALILQKIANTSTQTEDDRPTVWLMRDADSNVHQRDLILHQDKCVDTDGAIKPQSVAGACKYKYSFFLCPLDTRIFWLRHRSYSHTDRWPYDGQCFSVR